MDACSLANDLSVIVANECAVSLTNLPLIARTPFLKFTMVTVRVEVFRLQNRPLKTSADTHRIHPLLATTRTSV